MKASSIHLLLLSRGPWHCLWVGCICSAQHCCGHQGWAGFVVHTDILPGDFLSCPSQRWVSGSWQSSYLVQFPTPCYQKLIRGNVVVWGRGSKSRCFSHHPKIPKPVRLKVRRGIRGSWRSRAACALLLGEQLPRNGRQWRWTAGLW